MTVWPVLAFLSFGVAMYGCYVANKAHYKMIDEINKARRDDDQIDPYAFGIFRRVTILDALNEYRFHYPSGMLHLDMRLGMILLFAGMLSTACFVMIR